MSSCTLYRRLVVHRLAHIPSSSSIFSSESCTSLVCTLFDALNSGDNEARIATAKAMLTGDVWDDLEADMSMPSEHRAHRLLHLLLRSAARTQSLYSRWTLRRYGCPMLPRCTPRGARRRECRTTVSCSRCLRHLTCVFRMSWSRLWSPSLCSAQAFRPRTMGLSTTLVLLD